MNEVHLWFILDLLVKASSWVLVVGALGLLQYDLGNR